MLNPSTADEHVLDPTVKKCVKWAKQWGFRRARRVQPIRVALDRSEAAL